MTTQATTLIESLLSELGREATEDNVQAFAANHGDALIEDAAQGDVPALVELRSKCGLPIIR